MATRVQREMRNFGNVLEMTVKDIEGKSVNDLIDLGYRFTIVNDEGDDDMEVSTEND